MRELTRLSNARSRSISPEIRPAARIGAPVHGEERTGRGNAMAYAQRLNHAEFFPAS